MIYSSADANKIIEDIKLYQAKLKYQEGLVRAVLGSLLPYEGKKITKRLGDVVEKAFADTNAFWIYYGHQYRKFTINIRHKEQSYTDTLEIEIGREDKNDGRFSVEAYRETNKFYLDADAAISRLERRIDEVPSLAQRWNAACQEINSIEAYVGYQYPLSTHFRLTR